MKIRNIEKILAPKHFNWVGNAFYTTSFIGREIPRRRMDPFFAIGYNADIFFESSEIPRGVEAHPHKGFETVTIAYKGKIEHQDSKGNHGVIGEGDVQWMTAGSGILHREYHEEQFSKQGGLFQMVQLWVNLPAIDKETAPKYQNSLESEMMKVNLKNEGGQVNIIAGEFQEKTGKVSTFSPIHLYNAYINKGGEVDFTFPNNFNTAILVIKGAIEVNYGQVLIKDTFAMFENNRGETFHLNAIEENTLILVMSGSPLNEPIAHHGPFVMNTEAQLKQAYLDFHNGKFGVL